MALTDNWVSQITFDDSLNRLKDTVYPSRTENIPVYASHPSYNVGIGKPNDCASFVNSAFRFINSPDLSFAGATTDNPFSIELWIYRIGSVNNSILVKKGSLYTSTAEYRIDWYQGTSLRFYIAGGDGTDFSTRIGKRIAAAAIPANTWKHVIFSYDGSGFENGISIFINGVLNAGIGDSAGAYTKMIYSPAPIWFGGEENSIQAAMTNEYYGRLDTIRIRKDIITLAEAQSLYNAGSGINLEISSLSASMLANGYGYNY